MLVCFWICIFPIFPSLRCPTYKAGLKRKNTVSIDGEEWGLAIKQPAFLVLDLAQWEMTLLFLISYNLRQC